MMTYETEKEIASRSVFDGFLEDDGVEVNKRVCASCGCTS